jgi:hypothetical protein
MPLVVNGPGSYRAFAEPDLYECETVAHVRAIPLPADRAFALQGTASGGTLTLYKFDSSNATADNGGTILKPSNPTFDSAGRWIAVLAGTGAGGGAPSGATFQAGNGDPNGVVTGQIQGQTYLDKDDNELWVFGGTVGANTGWV